VVTVAGSRQSGPGALLRTRVGLTVGMVAANILGALAVFVLASYAVPGVAKHQGASVLTNAVVAGVYLAIALPVGTLVGFRRLAGIAQWLGDDVAPTPSQQLEVLRGPQRLSGAIGLLWAFAVIIFGVLNTTASIGVGLRVASVVAFGGVTTVAVAYLLAERILRDAAGRALSASPHPQQIAQSVAVRQVLTWVFGTGVPLLGLVVIGVVAAINRAGSRDEMVRSIVILGAAALATGLLTTVVAARATADPVVSVRRALARIERGELDASVPVYDGTDLGLLQAGFNRMAEGLREREHLRDLFGRHVGTDIARHALSEGAELGGEQRDVAVLFVDMVGSTHLAEHRAPADVVEVLNRFFSLVIDAVEQQGGVINKLAGDAALAVFGAPNPLADSAARALRAARDVANRFRVDLADFDLGVGVSSGLVVAGNVGTPSRLEYTVIGDPVNEAARLTELAKSVPDRVVASGVVVGAGGEEANNWVLVRQEVLRGRTAATEIYVLATGRQL
jgi:adenylate cyclase